jgi:anti-anti-sigma factor
MAVTVERDSSGLCSIQVDGEMTIYTALELKSQLLDPMAQGETFELKLSAVSEIDASGLQLLVLAKNTAQTQGKSLRLTDHSPAVLDVLALCDLEGFFGDTVLVHTPEKLA